jgi:thaumarchaeosortase
LEWKIKFSQLYKNKRILSLKSVWLMLVLSSPIFSAVIIYPNSFTLSWNEGRAGLLFAMVFIWAELKGQDLRKFSNKSFYLLAALSAITISYFVALNFGLRNTIVNAAPMFHIQLADSWAWMWDFAIMSIYMVVSLNLILGRKWLMLAPAGIIFLIGSTIILSLDAFFPYDSLGALQGIVPMYLHLDESVINFINSHITDLGHNFPAIARDNVLILNGLHGSFALKVFWPSAGVHSMIIYSLVMLVFLLKMQIGRERKFIYFIVGTIGTAAVNLLRIITLSLFALIVSTNPDQWESFHSIAAEIMFLPWLGIYVLGVIFLENKRANLVRRTQISSYEIIAANEKKYLASGHQNTYDSDSDKESGSEN